MSPKLPRHSEEHQVSLFGFVARFEPVFTLRADHPIEADSSDLHGLNDSARLARVVMNAALRPRINLSPHKFPRKRVLKSELTRAFRPRKKSRPNRIGSIGLSAQTPLVGNAILSFSPLARLREDALFAKRQLSLARKEGSTKGFKWAS